MESHEYGVNPIASYKESLSIRRKLKQKSLEKGFPERAYDEGRKEFASMHIQDVTRTLVDELKSAIQKMKEPKYKRQGSDEPRHVLEIILEQFSALEWRYY